MHKVYDDSLCIGSCMDKDPMLYWDYPNKRIWKDGYENRCEDYRVLDLCREDGYGSKCSHGGEALMIGLLLA